MTRLKNKLKFIGSWGEYEQFTVFEVAPFEQLL